MDHYFRLSSGHRLHYEEKGNTNSQAPPLVFLNGLSQSTLAWSGLIESSIGENFTCYPVDLIFQGQSDSAEEYRTFEQHADDLYELLSSLPNEQYFIVGISYGGAVAQRFMVKYPSLCRKVLLLSTFSYKTKFFNAIGSGWKQALLKGGYDLMFDIMLPFVLGRTYFENSVVSIDSLKAAKANMSPSTEDLIKLMKATEASENSFLPQLSSCPVDTLVVNGEEDFLCTPEMGKATAAALPNGTFKFLSKTGHTFNLEAVDELVILIGDFISAKDSIKLI